MATLDDEDEFITVLYYGDYGAGKTTALASMARLGTVKYIRPDRGLHKRPLKLLGIPTERIEPIDQFDPVSLEAMTDEWRELLEAEPGALAGICIDTATEWIARRIEVQVDADWDRYKNRMRKNREEIDLLARYTTGDGRDQYKAVTQEVRRVVRHVNDLKCHLAIACQRTFETAENKYVPAANPALRGDLIGYSGFTIRLEPEGTWPDGRQLIVGYPRPSERYTGKDQYSALPSRLADPTFDRVLEYAHGRITKDTDPVQVEYREIAKKRKKEEDEL